MVRPARPTDAEDMAVVQNGIYRAGLRESPVDVALVRRLFTTSLAAAGAGGLKHIDASIGVDNLAALVYCSAIGFTPYREGSDTIPHRFDVYQLVAGASQRIFVSQLRLSIAWPYALFPESSRAMVLALLTTAIAAGGVAAAWVFIAPTGFVFAWVTHFILMAWVLSVVRPRVRIPDYDWLRVRFWELRIYTGLGVRIFGKGSTSSVGTKSSRKNGGSTAHGGASGSSISTLGAPKSATTSAFSSPRPWPWAY